MSKADIMAKIISLCKRRGFIFQTSEIYGGLKSCYDYGPLGTELKRNIANHWWQKTVTEREDIVGMEGAIILHPKVWETSGHVSNFSDPLVDCHNCKERFRADKAPKVDQGSKVTYVKGGKKSGEKISGTVSEVGYICPNCGSSDLSSERQFSGMFKTTLGPIDPVREFIKENYKKDISSTEFIEKLEEHLHSSTVYLRPETAQAIFTQYLNIQQTMGLKVPFGIAQIGKSFRNEILTEHFIFRVCEFEQMEIEFFVEPGTQGEWLSKWTEERLGWHKSHLNHPEKIRLREHESDELAHYSDKCFDIEYEFPWGWDELEGVASRTDYDLKKHSEASGTKLTYFDQNREDPNTGKKGYRFIPYVIEPSAGLTRTLLTILTDAYTEDTGVDHNGNEKTRIYMKFHPDLAPIKVAVFPLVKKDGQPEKAQELYGKIKKLGINTTMDLNQSIGKRYAKHDEIGTPFCITVDKNTIETDQVTLRFRDTAEQKTMGIDEVVAFIKEKFTI